MSAESQRFKSALVGLLDAVAVEHPRRHQKIKAQRYVLTSRRGAEVEIMFEKNEDSPPNLWCFASAAGPKLIADVPNSPSPAADLWTRRGNKGQPLYGRHSALERLPQLGEADLVCFAPTSLELVGQILDGLLDVTTAELP
jgi:hypothetical protein